MGDGFCDPYNMVPAYSPLMYQFGMADQLQSRHILAETLKIQQCIKAGNYYDAFIISDKLFGGDFPDDNPTYFFNITGTIRCFPPFTNYNCTSVC